MFEDFLKKHGGTTEGQSSGTDSLSSFRDKYVKSDFSFLGSIRDSQPAPEVTEAPQPTRPTMESLMNGPITQFSNKVDRYVLGDTLENTVTSLMSGTHSLTDTDYNLKPGYEPNLFKDTMREILSLEHLPLGIGDIIKSARKEPETWANLSNLGVKDWGGVALETTKETAKSFIARPLLSVAGIAAGEIKFNVPGLGEVSNLQYQAAERVRNGENPWSVVVQTTPDAIFDGMMFVGMANKAFGSRPVTVMKGELPKDGKITTAQPKSFKYYSEPTNTVPVADALVQKMAAEKGITLPTDYNPTLPTYFRISSKFSPQGTITGELVQIRPSYFKTFLETLKGDATKVPPNQVVPLYQQTTSIQAIANAKAEPVVGGKPQTMDMKNIRMGQYYPTLGKELPLSADEISNISKTNPDLYNAIKSGKTVPPVPLKQMPDGKFVADGDGATRLMIYKNLGIDKIPYTIEGQTTTPTATPAIPPTVPAVTPRTLGIVETLNKMQEQPGTTVKQEGNVKTIKVPESAPEKLKEGQEVVFYKISGGKVTGLQTKKYVVTNESANNGKNIMVIDENGKELWTTPDSVVAVSEPSEVSVKPSSVMRKEGLSFDRKILPDDLKPYSNRVVENTAGNDAVLAMVPLENFGEPQFETLNQDRYTPGEFKIEEPIEVTYDMSTKEYTITDGANRFTQAKANLDNEIPAVVEIVDNGKAIKAVASKKPRTKAATTKPQVNEFYARVYGKKGAEEFKAVDGKPIEIAPGIETFIHRPSEGGKGWVISEGTTGLKIGGGSTRAKAIEDVKSILESQKKGGMDIVKYIKDKGKEMGVSPRYQKPEAETVKVGEDESFEIMEEQAEELPSYEEGGENASIGVFKDGTPIKAGGLNSIKPIEVPEMVRLVRELIGKFPDIKKTMGAKLGYFSGKEGNVFLRADQFKQGNENQLSKLIAHEIGHLVDWLPDKTLSRGNLLGHLMAMKKFMSSTFSTISGDALNLKEIRDRITSEVLKEKDLTIGDYIKDKSIREELKPEIDSRVEAVKTEEGVIQNSQIKSELTKVSEYWRPYDKKTSSPAYLKYRTKATEIYADTISMLFNSPGLLEEMAPTFYKEFFNTLDTRPEVKAAYFSLQELLNGSSEEIFKARMGDIKKGFDRAESIQEQFRAKQKLSVRSLWEKLRQQVDDANYPIYKKQKEAEAAGKVFEDEENPYYLLDEKSLVDNENFLLVEKIQTSISEPIIKAGMTHEDLGAYLLLDRIRKGRADIANPYGFNPKNANEQLDYLKKSVGDENFALLEQKAQEFHNIIWPSVEEAVRVGSYNQETFDTTIKPNKDNYAAFQVVDYMQDKMPATIKAQIGTLKEVANPFISTMLKAVSLNRLNAYQRAKNATIKLLQENFPGEISETRRITTDGKLSIFKPEEGKGGLEVLEDGKMASYDVDPYIAGSFKYDKVGDLNMIVSLIEKFNNKLFKPLVTTYNLGFAVGTNPIRDFRRNYKMIPGATVRSLLSAYVKSLPESILYSRGRLTEFTRALVDSKAINAPVNDYNFDAVDTEFKAILERFGIIKEEPSKILRSMAVKPLVRILESIRFLANSLEVVSKLAGARVRIAQGESGAELAYNLRNYTGTPNYRVKGTQTTTTNALFIFSNIIKEGLKSDIRIATNPNTRSGYWWKTVKMDILPKFLMFLASVGVFGKTLKEFFDKMTEYDKTNYTLLPLGFTPDGKAVAFRIPGDESGRLLSALFWKMANFVKDGKSEDLQQVVQLGAGQFPSITPLFDLASGWTQYLSGKNPYDDFRGRLVIDDVTYQAGGGAALKKMVQWSLNTLGLASFATYDRSKQSGLETFTQIVPWFKSMIKVTDYGLTEKYKEPLQEAKTQEARQSLQDKEVISKYAQDAIREGLTMPEAIKKYGLQVIKEAAGTEQVDSARAGSLLLKFKRAVTKQGIDDPRIDALVSATSNNQKAEVLKAIQNDTTKEEFRQLLIDLVGNKIITNDVLKKLNLKDVVSATNNKPTLLSMASELLGIKTAQAAELPNTPLTINEVTKTPEELKKMKTVSSSTGFGTYDLTRYAEDPKHEEKIARIVNLMPEFADESTIDSYIKSKFPKSPITGKMIINSATKYDVDPDVLLALGQQDSGVGTTGLGSKTKNFANYATYGKRVTRFKTWQSSIDATAEWLSKNKITEADEQYRKQLLQ